MAYEIREVSVVGTGTLGTQIALQACLHGCRVKVYDKKPSAFEIAFSNLRAKIEDSADKGMTGRFKKWKEAARRVQVCSELTEAVTGSDLVIEACPEKLVLKRKVFAEIDSLAPRGSILATNSSSIPISRIEDATKRPERCLNLHFYQVAIGMNIVDVMGGTRTARDVLECCSRWIRSIGCVPLMVKKEMLGFCFNSIWRAIKHQALHMWAEGYVNFKDIDRAWMIYFHLPQGPFGLMDQIGLDVVYDIEMVYFDESKDPRDYPPDALKEKIARQELGVKAGKGFYKYPNPEYRKSDFLIP